jgi:hypothetical protein
MNKTKLIAFRVNEEQYNLIRENKFYTSLCREIVINNLFSFAHQVNDKRAMLESNSQ